MHKDFKILEVTKENAYKYIHSIVQLEENVLQKMEQEGKIGQLFITGKDDILEYINSNNNHVIIAVKQNELGQECVISACYITKGQILYTYNDITKYFKCDEQYQEYIKSKYAKEEFARNIRETYINKICAFKYARNMILNNLGVYCLSEIKEQEKNEILMRMIDKEYEDPNNQFHEKSAIRDNLNKNMSLYMKYVKNDYQRYQEFYWIDYQYLKQQLGEKREKKKLTDVLGVDSDIETYDKILKYQKYKIYDTSNCSDISKYYNANTSNTIELDTYITHPEERKKGIAKILVFEGIKKALEEQLNETNNEEVFLASTLHKENLYSKKVSNFFELNDYLFVNRRNGRDRQVHIVRIAREDIPEYINRMENKIEMLYGYNKNDISNKDDEPEL